MPPIFVILLMFSSLMVLMLTGQRVFAVIGFVGSFCGLLLWGHGGGADMSFNAAIKLFNWYPMLSLPMFILFFSLQRYFLEGVTIGAVKG